MLLLPLAAVSFYFFSAIATYFFLVKHRFAIQADALCNMTALIAVCLHAIWFYNQMHISIGYERNLNVPNLFSLVLGLMSTVMILVQRRQQLQHLSILIFLLTAISIVYIIYFPTKPIWIPVNTDAWIHIWLAAFTVSMIYIAALQAIFLYAQHRLLHYHHHLPSFFKNLPALDSMERSLFQFIILGFLLLTLICLSSIYFFSSIFQPPLLQKTLLVLLAWIVLLILILGRYVLGWRGRKAVGYTLTGFLLLVLIYCGRFLIIL